MAYPVSEDTLFLKNFLKKLDLEGKKLLEIGTGSGEVAMKAEYLGARVTAVDKDSEVIEDLAEKIRNEGSEIELIESNLFDRVEGEFDVIVFNPPYLPGKRQSSADALVGGRKGIEITERFLEESVDYLRENGAVYFIGSSLSDLETLEEQFSIEIVDEEKLWFETLFLYRFST